MKICIQSDLERLRLNATPERGRYVVTVVVLAACAAVASADVVRGPAIAPPDPAEIRAYQAGLAPLRAKPPANEFFKYTKENKWLIRSVELWIEARAPRRVGGKIIRNLHVYLGDTVGNRVVTFPDQLIIAATPPAEVDVSPPSLVRFRNGSCTIQLTYAPEQNSASISLRPYPDMYVRTKHLSIQASGGTGLTLFDDLNAGGRATLPNLERDVADSLILARENAAAGRTFRAHRAAYAAGRNLLQVGEDDRALATFRIGDEEFGASRCAWAVWALLRKQGKTEEAARQAARIQHRYANSIPAKFLDPEPGIEWYVPDGGYFKSRVK